jgi:hypothetical protein
VKRRILIALAAAGDWLLRTTVDKRLCRLSNELGGDDDD